MGRRLPAEERRRGADAAALSRAAHRQRSARVARGAGQGRAAVNARRSARAFVRLARCDAAVQTPTSRTPSVDTATRPCCGEWPTMTAWKSIVIGTIGGRRKPKRALPVAEVIVNNVTRG